MGVLIQRDGPVATVVLDWPERLNAVDDQSLGEITARVKKLGADSSVSCVVLAGTGGFCAGGNLRVVPEMARKAEANRRENIEGVAQETIRAIVDLPVPSVAAVDGPAVGVGFDLAFACDTRLVGPHGYFIQGWGRLGLIPGAGGELLLHHRNPTILWKLLEEQRRVYGPEAEQWGMGEAVLEGTALEAALRRASKLSVLPRESLLAYVVLHRAELRRQIDDHFRLCADVQARLFASPSVCELAARLHSKSAARWASAGGEDK
jgi:enoyl-CoA hydratase/carnithine racemase